MAIMYFNTHDGSILTDKDEAGQPMVKQGKALAIEVPMNIAQWRLKADLKTKGLVIFGGIEKTDEQALEYKSELSDKEAIKNKEKADLQLALIEKQEDERKALMKKLQEEYK